MKHIEQFKTEARYRTLIIDMLERQKALNDQMAGEGWESKGLPWLRYVRIEAAELIIHHNSFKHWKKPDPDLGQSRLELVDIWFFMMSHTISMGEERQLINGVAAYAAYLEHQTEADIDVVKLAEDIQEASFRATADDTSLITLSYVLGVPLDKLYVLYLAKNALNQLRDNHGQKEGRYIKQWFGQEDNVIMQKEILDNPATLDRVMGADDPAQVVYDEMRTIYRDVVEEQRGE